MTHPHVSPQQYRRNLEKSKEEIMSALEHADKYSRLQLVKELRSIVDELNAMDEARSWINTQETQPKIEVNLSAKVLRRQA
jgi:hypothetical protein